MLVGSCHTAWCHTAWCHTARCHTPQNGKVNANVDLWLQSPWPWSLSWWRWVPHHAEGHRLWFPDLHGHPLQPAGPYAPCCEDHIQSAVCYRRIRACRSHPHTYIKTSKFQDSQYRSDVNIHSPYGHGVFSIMPSHLNLLIDKILGMWRIMAAPTPVVHSLQLRPIHFVSLPNAAQVRKFEFFLF